MKRLVCLLLMTSASVTAFGADVSFEPLQITTTVSAETLESAKDMAMMEFRDGNYGSASFLCEFLEKNNVDEPSLRMIWAASQSRMGMWNKAERLYLSVVNHKKSSKKQKSMAYVYLSKQNKDIKAKEQYANLALQYSKSDIVVDMVSQIYQDLEMDAISRSDDKKAAYFRSKHMEFLKNSNIRKTNEAGMEKF